MFKDAYACDFAQKVESYISNTYQIPIAFTYTSLHLVLWNLILAILHKYQSWDSGTRFGFCFPKVKLGLTLGFSDSGMHLKLPFLMIVGVQAFFLCVWSVITLIPTRQVSPGKTWFVFKSDPEMSDDSDWLCSCNKPHYATVDLHEK